MFSVPDRIFRKGREANMTLISRCIWVMLETNRFFFCFYFYHVIVHDVVQTHTYI